MLPRSSVTKFHHFGQYLKIFVKIFKVYLVLGKGLSSLWYNLYAFGQIFIAEIGQYWKHNLVVWSHGRGELARLKFYAILCFEDQHQHVI